MTDDEVAALADHPRAFWRKFTVTESDLDGFRHVNNAVYLKWIDATIWDHTRAVGLGEDVCMSLNRGMAAVRHEIDYLASALLGDEVVVYNWIVENDGRLRATRLIQMIRLSDRKTLLRAKSFYVSINLSTGHPTRMPEAFVSGYPVLISTDS
ncbi:acyl-CoA thioesterase [Shimia sp. R11_0]|uniref:acyl-CoA thioesterase n=1 Tax=Shimia sp. R11_0 TaxID=2821096 RepID=UPI001ADC8479|nr:acyl-CoA thioesterase [Shimia sp. R11_0]MBO9479613.1 acyl-CoA thioesterase [Shimia sp. R11_0]